jgi:NTP pyrophosphatase (non-canonical NTP hydrolase)
MMDNAKNERIVLSELGIEMRLLAERGFGERERILRKLMEELGEYAEAVEYANGSTNKIKKFAGRATPEEKLKEESCDLLMMALAAVGAEGFGIMEACRAVTEKLRRKRGAAS